MAINDLIKNATVMSGGQKHIRKNTPAQFADRQKEYYSDETAAFIQANAKYAGNYVKAQVQGVTDDFYEYTTQLIRMANIVSPLSQKIIDDTKVVLFANPAIDYIPRGAKIITMGSTWLVTNPQNLSSITTKTIVEKCNAVWRHLDWYGNILSEPISVQKTLMSGTHTSSQEFVLIANGYFNIKAQLNQHTAELKQNSRIILGSGVYQLRGVSDFIQEFTGDDNSVRILEFTGEYTAPNENDDMVNKVAGGLSFSWIVSITGTPLLTVDATAQFTATSERNGEEVTDNEEHPITYIWSSSNDSVATVDASGLVTAISEGEAAITATLKQNPSKKATFDVKVTANEAYVAFLSTPPASISQYNSVTLTAAYFVNGTQQPDMIEWQFSGAAKSAYSTQIDGNSVTITCWSASTVPLMVTALCGEKYVSVNIKLVGL